MDKKIAVISLLFISLLLPHVAAQGSNPDNKVVELEEFLTSDEFAEVRALMKKKMENPHVLVFASGKNSSGVADEYKDLIIEALGGGEGETYDYSKRSVDLFVKSLLAGKWPPSKKCWDAETLRIYAGILPKGTIMSRIMEEILKHAAKAKVKAPCERPASVVVKGSNTVYIIHAGEDYVDIGVIALNDDSAKKELKEFFGRLREKGASGKEEGGEGFDAEPPPRVGGGFELPEEQYAAIFVDTEKSVEFEGKTYRPYCHGEICVIIVPKSEVVGKLLCMQENRIRTCKEGTIRVYDLGKTVVTRRLSVEGEEKVVTYTAKGYVPVVVEVNVPKIDGRLPRIVGNFPYVDVDPVLRVYLKAYGGDVVVQQMVVERYANVIDEKIRFATCSLHVENLTTEVIKKEGYRIIVHFQITDGGDAVYVPDLRVKIGGKDVVPQYDERKRSYTAIASAPKGVQRISIEAEVDGCPPLRHVEEVYVGPGMYSIFLAIISFAVVVAGAYALMKIVMR